MTQHAKAGTEGQFPPGQVGHNLCVIKWVTTNLSREFVTTQQGVYHAMALIGYARISTGDQTLDLQCDALRAAGCCDIYEEQASGTKRDRPVLAQALRTCRKDDVLVIWRLDRLGRNTRHLLELIDNLHERGIGLKTLTGIELDTTSSQGRLIFQIFAALSEYERALIQERILAGVRAARARGRKGGRPMKLTQDQQQTVRDMMQAHIPITRIAKTVQCGRKTIYRYLARAAEQTQAAD